MKQLFNLCLVIVIFTTQSFAFRQDSLGITTINGKRFIQHKVETKETLYSLSRRYNVSIYKIIENNPPVEYGLEVGSIVNIPLIKKEEKKAKKEKQSQEQKYTTTESQLTHEVKAKETLFSISRQYGVTVADLKNWNNLTSNNIDLGQQLIIKQTNTQKSSIPKLEEPVKDAKTHIVEASETLYSISRKYEITVGDLKKWNGLQSNEIGIGQELIVGIVSAVEGDKPNAEKAKPKANNTAESSGGTVETDSLVETEKGPFKVELTGPVSTTDFKEIIESGVAALIEGSDDTRKYLALHRTAKVGTIIRVKNDMNGQEVFVRVLGKLPDTGMNDNIVIRLSKSAYTRLGAIDPKFRVTLSYIP